MRAQRPSAAEKTARLKPDAAPPRPEAARPPRAAPPAAPEPASTPEPEPEPQRRVGSPPDDAALGASVRQAIWVAYIGALLIAVGSVGPWTKGFAQPGTGLDGNGALSLMIAALIALMLLQYARSAETLWAGLALACGIAAAVIAGIEIADIQNEADKLGSGVSGVGWGILAVGIGGATVVLSSALLSTAEEGNEGERAE